MELDAELQDLSVDTDSAEIQWRRLSEQELKYIDGIQLRYRDVDVDAQVLVNGRRGSSVGIWARQGGTLLFLFLYCGKRIQGCDFYRFRWVFHSGSAATGYFFYSFAKSSLNVLKRA